MHKLFPIIVVSLLATATGIVLGSAKQTDTQLVRVVDGDTIVVRDRKTGNLQTVRFACVDAPELRQALGTDAREYLASQLTVGQSLTLRVTGTDRYQRVTAEVFAGNRSLNLLMVANGLAVVDQRYIKGCGDAAAQRVFLDAENQAKRDRLGLWATTNPCLPKDFRAGKCNQ